MTIRLGQGPKSTVPEDAAAITKIFDLIGQRERGRQDKQSINDFVTENIRLSGINETLPPEVQLTPDQVSQRAAANITNKGPQFSEGLAGGFQKFANRFTGGPSNVLTGPVASKLLGPSEEPTGIRRDLIRQQIESSQALTAQRKQKLEGTGEDSAKASLGKSAMTSFLNKGIKKQTKVVRKDGGALGLKDKVFGEDAYNTLKKDALSQKDEFGLSATEATQTVNQWWDKKFSSEKGQKFQKYQDRQVFDPAPTPEQKAAIDQIDPAIFAEITEAVNDGTLTDDEIKSIEAGLEADPTKAQQIVDEIRAGKGI